MTDGVQHLLQDTGAPSRADKRNISIIPARPPQYTALGYQAATYGREANISYVNGTADFQMRYDRDVLVGMGRTLYRDNWLVEGLVNRAIDYILGPTGFTLQARTTDPELNIKIEKEIWPAVVEKPEIRGIFDWPEFQALILREIIVPGDQGMIKMGGEDPEISGKVQHIESERIGPNRSMAWGDGGRVEQGVVLNSAGKPVAYQICNVGAGGYIQHSPGHQIPAQNFLYVGQPFKRSSQTRCIPMFTSGLPLAHRLDDVLTAATIAWQIQSRLVVGIYRDGKTQPTIASGKNAGTKATLSSNSTDLSSLVTEMGYSIIFQGQSGDKIEPIAQNRPGANLKDDVLTFVRLFCVPIGMPAEVLLLFWPDFNYSSGRIVLLQAFAAFRRLQQHLVRKFFTPHYHWQIGRAVADGRLPWRPDILNHEWQVPSWPWIDEDKEMSAWAQKLDRSIATQTAALASLGLDRAEQQDVRKTEIVAAWNAAKKIEADTMGGIKAAELWRHLAGLETGKTESAVRAKPQPSVAPGEGGPVPEDIQDGFPLPEDQTDDD